MSTSFFLALGGGIALFDLTPLCSLSSGSWDRSSTYLPTRNVVGTIIEQPANLDNMKTQATVQQTNIKQNWYQVSSSKISLKAAENRTFNYISALRPANSHLVCGRTACQLTSWPCGPPSAAASSPCVRRRQRLILRLRAAYGSVKRGCSSATGLDFNEEKTSWNDKMFIKRYNWEQNKPPP